MSLSTDKKLYLGLGVLVLLGGAYFLQQRREAAESAAFSWETKQGQLPALKLTAEELGKATRLVVRRPADASAKPPVSAVDVTLEKQGDKWKLVKPVSYAANQESVTSLLDSLPELGVVEQIGGPADYARFGVDDGKATVLQLQAGDKTVLDLRIGKSGTRGQMARIGSDAGVYSLKGLNSFAMQRDADDWRDKQLFRFDEKGVASVTIENEHGTFEFTNTAKAPEPAPAEPEPLADGTTKPAEPAKPEPKWEAKVARKGAASPLEKLDETKVTDLVRAYQALNAVDFGDDKKPGEVNLDTPLAKLTIVLSTGERLELHVGANSDSAGSNRWVRRPGQPQLFTISGWAAGFAMADEKKFQKDEKKAGEKGSEDSPAPGPGGLEGMPEGMGMGMGQPNE